MQWLGRVTVRQYNLITEAARRKRVDEFEATRRQAWLNAQARAKKKVGDKILAAFRSYQEFCEHYPSGSKRKPTSINGELKKMIAEVNKRGGE